MDNGLTVNFGSWSMQVQTNVTYEPSKTFNINLSVKLYYDLTDFISGGLNNMGMVTVCLAAILPYKIEGMKYLYLPTVNLNTASLFPGFVNFIDYLVAI